MIKFIKNTWPALLMVFFAIANEYVMGWLSITFKVTDSGSVITWGDVMYHGVIKLGYTSLLPAIVLYFKERVKSTQLIYLGLIFWNIKEIADRIYYVAEEKLDYIPENAFYSITENGMGFAFQVINIILVVIFAIIAYSKCSLFFRSLALFSWPYWRELLSIRKRSKRN